MFLFHIGIFKTILHDYTIYLEISSKPSHLGYIEPAELSILQQNTSHKEAEECIMN